MRALVLLACLAGSGCEWNTEEQNACRRTPGCDAGVSGTDGGQAELQPRALSTGSLIGLSSLNDLNAWAVIKPAGANGLAFFLSPQDGGVQLSQLAVTDPRAMFGMAGFNSFAIADATGTVSLHSPATGASTSSVNFRGVEPQLLTQYVDDSNALGLSVWGTIDGGNEYAHQVSINQAPPTPVGGCGQPRFHDAEILGADLRGGALLSLHTELGGCVTGPFTSPGAWLEHVDNAGTRRGLLLSGATGDAFAVGRLERPDGGPMPVVGYAEVSQLIVSEVNDAGTDLVLTRRGSVQATAARFGDFVRGSREVIITGVTSGEVRLPSDAGLSAVGGTNYAFVARLTQPGWVRRLGPATSAGRVLGVKVGTSALVFAWDSPDGVVWTVLAEDDGRELRP